MVFPANRAKFESSGVTAKSNAHTVGFSDDTVGGNGGGVEGNGVAVGVNACAVGFSGNGGESNLDGVGAGGGTVAFNLWTIKTSRRDVRRLAGGETTGNMSVNKVSVPRGTRICSCTSLRWPRPHGLATG